MNNNLIDCRGLACPQPVLKVRDAIGPLAKGEVIELIVDNEAARDNVIRFCKSQGHSVATRSIDNVHHLTIARGSGIDPAPDALPPEEYSCAPLPQAGIVCLIPADTMGRGDEALGRVLMRAFIKTLKNLSLPPRQIFFYNTGVKITASESDLIEPLRELAAMGVEIFSCGTCLDFFNLKGELLVGETTNMFEIMDSMTKATKVITPC